MITTLSGWLNSLCRPGSDRCAFRSGPGGRRLLETLVRQMPIIELVAVLAMRSMPLVGAVIGQVQGRVTAQLGNQVQATLPHHVPGRMIAKMPIQDQIGQRDPPGHQFELGLQHGLDAQQFRRQDDFGRRFVLAAFGRPALAWLNRFGRVFGGGFGLTGGLFGRAAHDLLDAHRKRAALLRTDQRQPEKGQTRNHPALQTGKEAIQPMGAVPALLTTTSSPARR